MTRFNAVRHGVLSKHTVLPWEDEAEYGSLLQALVDEHKPNGPMEKHLVEDSGLEPRSSPTGNGQPRTGLPRKKHFRLKIKGLARFRVIRRCRTPCLLVELAQITANEQEICRSIGSGLDKQVSERSSLSAQSSDS